MSNKNENIAVVVDDILDARKRMLPELCRECKRIEYQDAELGTFRDDLLALVDMCKDDEPLHAAKHAIEPIDKVLEENKARRHSIAELQAEFDRDSLNIGVSGAARTGKSTTLQHITGLTDQQIPSGVLNPVTAVRSEIYNDSRNEAIVSFLSEHEFIVDYVRPHADNVNDYLPQSERLSIESLTALKCVKLPERLEGNVATAATDSLKRLKEAQRSASSYEAFLGANNKTISLDDVREYTTYPSPEEERLELEADHIAKRQYLAVKVVRVYCQFPHLGNAKVGLVDLPGLGEIGNSASERHLEGLESSIDQILLVTRPTSSKAFVDNVIAHNLDQLQNIQPAVQRGDLVLFGINKDAKEGQQAAENLRAQLDAEVNGQLSDGGYAIEMYDATNDGDVARLFGVMLDRFEKLPEMDRQKIDYCMKGSDNSVRMANMADEVVHAMNDVLRNIPSPDKVMNERISSIASSIIGDLTDYADGMANAAGTESRELEKFKAKATEIHNETERRIENGLFMRDEAEWETHTRSSKDFYNLYRDEAKRIRFELIDAYCGLDRFYDDYVNDFKSSVLDIILRSCGMDSFFKFDEAMPANERIARVKSELGSTLHEDGLDDAFDLLTNVRFDFRSNVFLGIEEHLANLANPKDRGERKREALGGAGSSESKQESMREWLVKDAVSANKAILEALVTEDDMFNRYLAVSIDFFNNALFGKDEETFRQVVIRGLIREYREYVLPDADDASKSPLGALASQIKDKATVLKDMDWGAQVDAINVATTSASSRATKVHTSAGVPRQNHLKSKGTHYIGQVVKGRVTALNDYGATIRFDSTEGFLPKGEISHEWVDDPRDYLAIGDDVRVKIIGTKARYQPYVLSIKRYR